MFHLKQLLPLALVITGGAAHVDAQFWAKLTAPRTKVVVNHPPQVALPGIANIAVTDFTGECGAELTDRLTQALTESAKFQVLDRIHLKSILDEQTLTTAGVIDSQTAAKLSRVLGPTAIVFGRVNRCTIEEKPHLVETAGNQTNYLARVTGFVQASVNLVDVTTARTLGVKTIEGRAEKTNRSNKGVPELPDRDEVRSEAYVDFIRRVSRLVLPWKETVEAVVHNDDQWDLKKGAGLLKAGEASDAVALFESIVKTHEKHAPDDDKVYAKALYDLGVALVCDGRPQDGLPFLKQSLALREADVTTDAISLANKMMSAQQQFKLQELAAAGPVLSSPPAAEPKPAPASAKRAAAADTQPKPAGGGDIEADLVKLKSLYEKGLITQAEYDKKKAELLKKLGS